MLSVTFENVQMQKALCYAKIDSIEHDKEDATNAEQLRTFKNIYSAGIEPIQVHH